MARWLIGKNGTVLNVVEAPSAKDADGEGNDVLLDATGTGKPGDTYDVKDIAHDRLDVVTHKIIFQLLNDVRVLKGQATITAAQYKNAIKALM